MEDLEVGGWRLEGLEVGWFFNRNFPPWFHSGMMIVYGNPFSSKKTIAKHLKSGIFPGTKSRLQICPLNIFGQQAATDGFLARSKYWCFTRVWRLGFFGPSLQPKV